MLTFRRARHDHPFGVQPVRGGASQSIELPEITPALLQALQEHALLAAQALEQEHAVEWWQW
jgi:hypothetical protein